MVLSLLFIRRSISKTAKDRVTPTFQLIGIGIKQVTICAKKVSIDYEVWITPDLSEIKIERYEKRDLFEECSKCNNRTLKLKEGIITLRPTYTAKGKGTKSFECKICKNKETHEYHIPKKRRQQRTGGSGGYVYGGGGFSGGGFSGGGRFSGGW